MDASKIITYPFKIILSFIKKHNWLVEHGFSVIISIILTLSFSWLIKNWEAEIVVYNVKIIADFLDKNLYVIEPTLTLIIFVLFTALGRIIKHYRKGSMAISAGMFFYS